MSVLFCYLFNFLLFVVHFNYTALDSDYIACLFANKNSFHLPWVSLVRHLSQPFISHNSPMKQTLYCSHSQMKKLGHEAICLRSHSWLGSQLGSLAYVFTVATQPILMVFLLSLPITTFLRLHWGMLLTHLEATRSHWCQEEPGTQQGVSFLSEPLLCSSLPHSAHPGSLRWFAHGAATSLGVPSSRAGFPSRPPGYSQGKHSASHVVGLINML